MATRSDRLPRDWWKTVAVFLAGVTLTGVSSWFAFWSQIPTKKEVAEMIQTQTPYVMDRAALRKGVEQNTKTLEMIRQRLREVEKKQIQLSSDFQNRIGVLIDLINNKRTK